MSPVAVTFLGSGDAFGSGGRNQASILVDLKPWAFLLDCGATTLIALKRQGIDPGIIRLILLSHLHGDHAAGVPFLFLEYQFLTKREEPLVIAGPPGTEETIEGLFQLMYPEVSEMPRGFAVEYLELEARRWRKLGPVDILPLLVPHRSKASAYGYKVGGSGRTIAYSGDTAWGDVLIELSDGADLFICECSLYERRVPVHISFQDLAAHLSELRCQRMLLTHLNTEMLKRLNTIPLEVAWDGLTVEL